MEVVTQLRDMGEEGVSLQVVSLLPSPEPRGTVSTWPGKRSPTLSPTQPWSFPHPHPPGTQREGGQVAFTRGGFLGSGHLSQCLHSVATVLLQIKPADHLTEILSPE